MSSCTRDFDMKKPCSPKLLLLVWTALLLWQPALFGSKDATQPSFVSQVTVLVNGVPGGLEFLQLVPIKKGDAISLKSINTSIKQIYKTGLFSDVRVLSAGEDSVGLTYLLTRKLVTRGIVVRSNENIPQARLRQNIYSLRPGEEFSDVRLSRAVEELQRALNQEGYFSAEIKSSKTVDPKTSEVNVRFDVASLRKYMVKDIRFTGDVLLPLEELEKTMELKTGEVYNPEVLNQDIERLKDLYQSLDYQRAEIRLQDTSLHEREGKVSLILEVLPNEKIEIVIQGADVPEDLVLPIWETRIFEEWGLAEGEAKILIYMRKKGYIFATVTSQIRQEENRIQVLYQVQPNQKFKIQSLSFEGLRHFTSEQIMGALLIGRTLPFFSQIDGARLFELPREIEFLYTTYGFPETRVDINFQIEGNKVKPVLSIEEGRQQKIQDIQIEGAELFSTAQLLSEISSRPGGGFFQANIQKDVEKLESFYLNSGVRGTEIISSVQNVEEDLFNVLVQVQEGRKVRIGQVLITGNDVTRKSTILRELTLQEGDYAFYDATRETERRLENLGIFTDVTLEEIPLAPGTVNLLINVREGERNYAGLGLGIETRNEPRMFEVWNTMIRPRGTAEFIRSNIFGWAAQLSLVGQISIKERRGVISWEQPYFFGLPLQTFANSWLEREERKSYTFERRGFSLSTIRPLSSAHNMVLVTTLRVARTELLELYVSPSEVDRQFFPFSTTSLSGSFIWDRRDDPFNPTNGMFFSSVVEWAYPLFQDESNYVKTFNKFQHFVSVIPDLTFGSTIRLGLGKGRMPIHERFFGGGSNSFRGVEFDELGPKDPNSLKPVGGKGMLLFNFELTLPLHSSFKNLLGAVFYDVGNVFAKRRQVALNVFQHAVGCGLRYRTPLGPIRLEMGWNFTAPEEDKKVLLFITIGNVF